MRALTLDYRRQYRASWVGIVLLLAGVAGAGILWSQYAKMADEAAQAELGIREQGVATRKKVVVAGPEGEAQKVALEIRHAREILFQLSMPWNELFASFEGVEATNVALLGIQSDIDKRRVKINAEAKNLGAMLDYVRALEGRPAFADVYLQSHQVQQQDPERPVRFVLSATWLVRR